MHYSKNEQLAWLCSLVISVLALLEAENSIKHRINAKSQPVSSSTTQ
jgi:hypothetical protein